MKYIYYAFLILLLISCGKEEKKVIDREKTDWAFYKLNGNVKAISQKSYETADGKQTGPSKHEISSDHDSDMEFNDEGMLIAEKKWSAGTTLHEEVQYKGKDHIINKIQYSNGSPSLKTNYAYDEKGKNNLSVTRRNGNNTPFDKVVMKYKNDQLIERINYNHQQNPVNRTTYYYDKKGNLTGQNSFGSTDVIQFKTEFAYNDKNQKVRETHYKNDGVKDYEILYTYAGDKIATSKTYNANGELSYEEKKSYDTQGNLLSHYTYDKFDGSKTREEYTYDKKGNRTGWNIYNGSDLVQKATYTYDEYGNITKVMVVDAGGSVQESKLYNYEYDEKGNWTKRLLIKDNRPAIITKRTITYYEE